MVYMSGNLNDMVLRWEVFHYRYSTSTLTGRPCLSRMVLKLVDICVYIGKFGIRGSPV